MNSLEPTATLYGERHTFENPPAKKAATEQKTSAQWKNVCQLFEEQVARSGRQIAVVDEKQQITYEELNGAANYIAGELLKQGVGRGKVVAIMFSRTVKAIAAMIGIQKAGAAYLPIDVNTPLKRILTILDSSAAAAILTTKTIAETSGLIGSLEGDAAGGFVYRNRQKSETASNGSKDNRRSVLFLDWDVHKAPLPLENPSPSAKPDDLAYVIYTSGSTGIPKGAMIEHRNVINLVSALDEAIIKQYGPQLRVALIAPFVFDASVQQIFSSLLLGHTLYIASESARRDAKQLAEFYIRNSIDISDGTPAHLKILSHVPRSAGNALPVKHFIIGGEILRTADIENFSRRFSQSQNRITNIYGVAECAVDSISYTIDPAKLNGQEIVPIGTPLKGTRIHILDDEMKPVPAGEIGELCIAGEGIGRGYLNASDMTAERFVPHFSRPDEIIYKTGDLAAFQPDGNLILYGRKDKQIKVRGYRIEPAEIEAKLLSFNHSATTRSIQLPILGQKAIPTTPVQCGRCLLSTVYSGVTVNEEGICSVCQEYEKYRSNAVQYFRALPEFSEVMQKARSRKQSEFDCLLLYSGGKDSTYVLYKLLDQGLKVLTLTFDNGFISESAFENIKRITNQFNVEHINVSTDRMSEIFVESLATEQTVCGGCFRALTALSTRVAEERGINVIITGLSRGQIFDTKLKQLYEADVRDPAEIEKRLIVHRKIYHLRKDTISSLLNAPVSEDAVEKIFFLDYFRYDSASGPDVISYLAKRDQRWQRPEDTGFCSTNCRINDVGIYVHKAERGYHNYGAPLSWDIRLGVITQEEGRKKLADEINTDAVNKILDGIGYKLRESRPIKDAAVIKMDEDTLAAYIVADGDIDLEKVSRYISAELPEYMVPAHIVPVDSLPLTVNGKLDVKALPGIDEISAANLRPETSLTETETRLRRLWEEVFQLQNIRKDADFFRLGGSSLKATILLALIEEEFNVECPLATVFDHPTISELADFIDSRSHEEASSKEAGSMLLRRGTDGKRHLFFIHDSSGGVTAMIQLSKNILPDFNVWGIQVEDTASDEIIIPSIEQMAADYIERIRAIQGEGACYVGGWSFGGVVAYEIAAQLYRRTQPVGLLTVIDSVTPNKEHWNDMLVSFVGDLRGAFPQVSEMVAPIEEDKGRECLQLLTRIGRFRRAAERIRTCTPSSVVQAIPDWDNLEQEELFAALKKVMSYVAALAAYAPLDERPEVDLQEFRVASGQELTSNGNWQNLVSGPAQQHLLDGDHRSILVPPVVNELADKLNRKLKEKFAEMS